MFNFIFQSKSGFVLRHLRSLWVKIMSFLGMNTEAYIEKEGVGGHSEKLRIFSYSALTPQGQLMRGRVLEENKANAYDTLKRRQLAPIYLKRQWISDRIWFRHNFSEELLRFFMYLDYGIRSGQSMVDLMQSMMTLFSKKMQWVLADLSMSLNQGILMSEKCSQYSHIFSPVLIAMIQLGERSGRFSDICIQIQDYIKSQQFYRKKFIKAMTYPCLSLLTVLTALGFLHQNLVPQMVKLFEEQNMPLPWSTQFLCFFLDFEDFSFLGTHLFIILICCSFLYFLFYPHSKKEIEKFVFRFLPFGRYSVHAQYVHFLQAFSVLYHQNISLLQALRISSQAFSSLYLKEKMDMTIDRVEKGSRLCEALRSMPFLNPIYISLLKTGEETGHLKPALKYTSEAAAADFAHQCEKLLDRIQPLFLMATGVLFLTILYGTLFPLYQEMNRLFVSDLGEVGRCFAYV